MLCGGLNSGIVQHDFNAGQFRYVHVLDQDAVDRCCFEFGVLPEIVIDMQVLCGMIGFEVLEGFRFFLGLEQEAERGGADDDGDAMHVFLR